MKAIKSLLARGVLWLYGVVVLVPLFWMGYTALKSAREIFGSPWSLPTVPQWDNFYRAWTKAHVGQYLLNSVFVTVVSVGLIVLLSAMAAYALVRFPFRGSEWILSAFVAGLMVPVQLALVPLYGLLRATGLLDSYIGLILVYIAFSLPFTVFLLSGFFKTMPSALEDAAAIDGCSRMTTFWLVMLPIAKPGLVTAAIFNFVGIWNEFLLALIILARDEIKTLPLGLANLQMVMQYETDWGALFAGLVIAILPILLAFLFLRRQITEGVTIGAVKG